MFLSSHYSLPIINPSPHFSLHYQGVIYGSIYQPQVAHSKHCPFIHFVHAAHHIKWYYHLHISSTPVIIPSPQTSGQGKVVDESQVTHQAGHQNQQLQHKS
ncbi:unnamed protein product (macronuclear) [Paramecium tetraurelia]|uniref:Uncharacterized protein n=1 Tax=Paramecium tetraurelia TaxID=5888 RepID=A0CI54_PARTE|nr:uncharacterized protein GSPATT00038575001 [Paramecium tetraurelia]CAK70471.1 unnamed protein product [Paramecium tetraurelia]|eukprot:XP_001437868.1 hypothetical protein (macronuclear) [Paramecium tetraurelia strain d4-2]